VHGKRLYTLQKRRKTAKSDRAHKNGSGELAFKKLAQKWVGEGVYPRSKGGGQTDQKNRLRECGRRSKLSSVGRRQKGNIWRTNLDGGKKKNHKR